MGSHRCSATERTSYDELGRTLLAPRDNSRLPGAPSTMPGCRLVDTCASLSVTARTKTLFRRQRLRRAAREWLRRNVPQLLLVYRVQMPKSKSAAETDHPIATAVGRAL